MATKDELPSRQPRRHGKRSLYIILSVVAAIVTVALAFGLGVGLTRSHQSSNNNNDAGSSNSSSSSGSSQSLNASTPSISDLSTPGMGNISSSPVTPYVYGAYQPPVNASWQIALLNPLQLDFSAEYPTPNVDVWDIDMFTNKKDTVNWLHSKGKRVICYFSAGSYEPSRPDSSQFTAADKGNELNGWPGEYWLNTASSNVRNIMANRIKYAHDMGCDAIDPDNVDGYSNDNGIGLTEASAVDFINFLSDTAATYNISTGLKNAAAIIPQVISKTAFQVNEQCAQYNECHKFDAYIQSEKPVFHIEYPKGDSTNNNVQVSSSQTQYCANKGSSTNSQDFSTVVKNMNLDGWVQYCDGQTAVTPCSDAAGKGNSGDSSDNSPSTYGSKAAETPSTYGDAEELSTYGDADEQSSYGDDSDGDDGDDDSDD